MSRYIYIVSRRLQMIYFLYEFQEKYGYRILLRCIKKNSSVKEKSEGKQKKTQ